MKLFITILFGGCIKFVYTQCEGVYMYDLAPDQISSIDINKIKGIDSTENKYIIYIDTIYDHRFFLFNLREPEFYIELSNKKDYNYTYNVVNALTAHRFNMGPMDSDYKNFREDIVSTSNFIYTQNEKKTIMFDYNKSEIQYLNHPFFDILGYDNKYVFLLLREIFEYKNKIYYPGSIFRFDGSELQLVEENLDTSGFTQMNDIIFLNSNYRVENTFINKEYIDCKNLTHFSSKVYYNNLLIDSSSFKSEYAITENCAYSNDTLHMWLRFENRKFIDGKTTGTLNISDTLKQQPEIKKFVDRYRNLPVYYKVYDNYLIAAMHLDPRDTLGFIQSTKITNNGIAIDEKCRRYDLVLLFNARDLAFLGYPVINFGDW